MKQNLPEELLQSERGERKMNRYVSRDRGGKKETANFNSVQTGRVNKEFQGVASLNSKYGKPQSRIRISHSLQGPTPIHRRTQLCWTVATRVKNVEWGPLVKTLYCVRRTCVLTGVTKRSRLYVQHACMTEWRWVTVHACLQLPPQIP